MYKMYLVSVVTPPQLTPTLPPSALYSFSSASSRRARPKSVILMWFGDLTSTLRAAKSRCTSRRSSRYIMPWASKREEIKERDQHFIHLHHQRKVNVNVTHVPWSLWWRTQPGSCWQSRLVDRRHKAGFTCLQASVHRHSCCNFPWGFIGGILIFQTYVL